MTAAPPRPDPADQLVEEVDVDGRVLRLLRRSEIRAGNVRHRAVSIAVRRPADGALLVHRRAGWKDLWPGRWDLAFGGVVDPGETDDDAARRELAEEAGVTERVPVRVGPAAYDAEVRWVGSLYEVITDGPFRFDDGEVAEVRWVPMDELARWIDEHPTCPDNTEIVGRWLLGDEPGCP